MEMKEFYKWRDASMIDLKRFCGNNTKNDNSRKIDNET